MLTPIYTIKTQQTFPIWTQSEILCVP
jgi:hypothetical protein